MKRIRVAVVLACVMALTTTTGAQVGGAQSVPTTLTLEQALQYALEHYPTVRAALEQVTASTANVSVAKAASLPRFDSVWQTNRATANNIFG
jgi:outer membrane protein